MEGSAAEGKVVLEEKVRERTQDLKTAQLETLKRLALAAEYRDDTTGLHTRRVGLCAGSIAQALGLPDAQVDLILRVAPLHDVGKVGVPDGILLKPGKLTDEEFGAMKQHATIWRQSVFGQQLAMAATGGGDCPDSPRALGRQRVSGWSAG